MSHPYWKVAAGIVVVVSFIQLATMFDDLGPEEKKFEYRGWKVRIFWNENPSNPNQCLWVWTATKSGFDFLKTDTEACLGTQEQASLDVVRAIDETEKF